MNKLPLHTDNSTAEKKVDPTATFSGDDLLRMVTELMNNNLENTLEMITNQLINRAKITIYFTADLCRIYNVSESTIYNYRKSGRLNYCSDGQKVWFTQEHIDDFNRLTDCRYKQTETKKTA